MKNTIKNRYEMIMLVQAKNCNPRGDTDAGNEPTIDPSSGKAIITDVAIKRDIRDYIQDAYPEQEILISNGRSINKAIAEAVLSVNKIDEFDKNFTNKKVPETSNWLAEKYYDVRAFGGVLSTGRNGGQVRGAAQVAIAESFDAVNQNTLTITRMAYTDGKDFGNMDDYIKEESARPENKKRTMGNKGFISYGLFPIKVTVSAALAEKVGFTECDLKILQEAVLQCINHEVSSSKMGYDVVSPLIIFKHVGTQDAANAEEKAREAKLGCASAYKLFSLLKVSKKEGVEFPQEYTDYSVSLDWKNIPDGVEVWVKKAPFCPAVAGDEAIKALISENINVTR